MRNILQDIRHNQHASIIVFFVAIPISLGIALASDATLNANMISGGILIGAESFNMASVKHTLETIPANSKVSIDCSHSKSIAYDVVALISEYESNADIKKITVDKINFKEPTYKITAIQNGKVSPY
jgi:hypothetical protein